MELDFLFQQKRQSCILLTLADTCLITLPQEGCKYCDEYVCLSLILYISETTAALYVQGDRETFNLNKYLTVKCVLVASGVSTGEAWSMASRIWAGPRLPSPQIQKGWLFPCYSCTVRPTGVLPVSYTHLTLPTIYSV